MPRAGREFGSYRILKLLGAGGMGEVYLALDARLGRQIALKFLPLDLTTNEVALRRFKQEARTASALNHPNILTIYEVGEADGEFFIASEYVDGITLREALRGGRVDVATTLDIAIQVASALQAAHSAGVVHRDLKPGNIMIRRDGYVKVIDFGLAKLTQGADQERSVGETGTRPGVVTGTLDYMSPEQARGKKVDHRTDLWSLGVVLYEMLAHRRPFEGDTDSHVVVGILDHAVPPIDSAATLPPGLIELIGRALAKNFARRYQTAGEMLADLREITERSGLARSTRPITFPHGRRYGRTFGLSLAIVVVLVLSWATWWWGLNGKETVLGPDWFRVETVRQLTFNGRTKLSCISPDGRYLAFVAGDAGGTESLFLKQVDQSSEAIKIPARHIDYRGITFSPDSQTIFEVEEDEKLIGKLYAVPILGDRPSAPILVDIDGPVSFSPSGDQFAFVRYLHTQHGGKDETKSLVEVAGSDGSGRQSLVSLQDFTALAGVAWAPEGNRIAGFVFSNSSSESGTGVFDLIDLKGHETRRALPNWRLIGQPWWVRNGETLIADAATRTEGQNHKQLRELAVDSGEIRDVTKDLAGYSSGSLTRDGQQLAAVKMESKASLWVSSTNDPVSGHSVSAEAAERPSLAWQDQEHLIMNSQRSGFPNLWLFDVNAQRRASLTNEPYVEQDAISVPGGNSIIFSSNRSGEFHLWSFDPELNAYRQLTSGPAYDETPSISRDGKWIVYTSWTGTNPHLYKIPRAGGPRSLIAPYLGTAPDISPDGRFVACHMQDPRTLEWRVGMIPLDGEAQPRFFPNARLPVRWSPDGTALATVLTDGRGVSNIWAVPLDGSPPRQITHFDDETILKFAWSPQGDRLACIRASSGADVVLFKRQKSK
jgi:Tol biopolymer transport system component